MRRVWLLRLALLVGVCALRLDAAHACAVINPGVAVQIADEEAIIVWDARTQTEHFIRRAAFRSDANSFGFLVPTPTPPHLAEAQDQAFSRLAAMGRPPVVVQARHGLKFTSLFFTTFGMETRTAGIPNHGTAVDVLDAEHIAGYDAVVLKADDAPALAGWLHRHGYQAKPGLADWLRPYVRRHWAITAFKVSRPKTPFPVPLYGSPAARMSFTTPRAFFPYSEPADQRSAGQHAADRLLRLFVLSDARMDGVLDSAAVRWPGRVRWVQSPPPTENKGLEAELGLGRAQMPVRPWLTVFEDTSSPRPGLADLYFRPSAAQVPLALPTVVVPVDARIAVPIELLLAAGLGLMWGLGAVLRREARR